MLVLQFLQQIGRVRANEIYLQSVTGEVFYRSPPATYKAGREAPQWFFRLLAPPPARYTFPLRGSVLLVVEAQPSRAVLDAWDDITPPVRDRHRHVGHRQRHSPSGPWRTYSSPSRSSRTAWSVFSAGNSTFACRGLAGFEAHAIGTAFNRMAQAVEDKVAAERKARDAEARLEERREMASLADQRVEEERRLIAHELHDEFGQSVTAIRSLALAIATQGGARDPEMGKVARLISDEAARLYDAMHGLIPRLAPLSLDTLGLAATLESLVRDWQRRHPADRPHASPGIARRSGPERHSDDLPRGPGRPDQCPAACAALARRDRSASDGRQIVARVTDDGIGLPADWARPGHFGLRGLADRVRQFGRNLRHRQHAGPRCAIDRLHSAGGGRQGMIRVLLVDDHAVVRIGFRLLLQSLPEMSVVAEADSGEAACQLYLALAPDVVVMDLAMPGMGGLEALRRIRARDPQARILDTLRARRSHARPPRAAGRGLGVPVEAQRSRSTARGGERGRRRPALPRSRLAQKLALAEFDGGAKSPIERLSEREFEVFVRLAGGATVQRIAQDLNLSASTIGTHLYNIKQKLSVANQSELTLIAIRHGLIEA